MISDPASGTWHLDKRVPLAIIFAIIVQSGSIIYWASGIDHQVAQHEAWIAGRVSLEPRLAVLEWEAKEIRRILEKIDRQLEAGKRVHNTEER